MDYIAYYRVSTKKQGRSGLGLEAQLSAVRVFLRDIDPIASYTDIESGAENNRPQLLKALAHAKRYGATLLIAKLDRLSRNVTFISTLIDNSVKFTCCDMPEANEFTIHLMAALAQWERKRIRERIVVALAAKKQRGDKLGSVNNLTSAGRKAGNESNRLKAVINPNFARARAMAALLRNNGYTLQQIADNLNASGFTAASGGLFNSEQVRRILNRSTQVAAA